MGSMGRDEIGKLQKWMSGFLETNLKKNTLRTAHTVMGLTRLGFQNMGVTEKKVTRNKMGTIVNVQFFFRSFPILQ